MAKRIPDKKVDKVGYYRYFYEKYTLAEIKAVRDKVALIALECVTERAEDYKNASVALEQALIDFEKGWRK